MIKLIGTVLLICMFQIAGAQVETKFQELAKVNLSGDAKWDYMCVDDERALIYVSHGDRVHVLNTISNKVVAEIPNLNSVHGIAYAKEVQKLYIANTGSNTVEVYDAKTWKKTNTLLLKGGEKPDCILWDSFTKKVFVFCGKSNNAFVFDAKADELLSVIDEGGKPEFACTDGAGTIYNNIEDKNELLVIDAKTMKVKAHYALFNESAPTGIAIDKANQILFVVCSESKMLVVLDAVSGQLISKVPIGAKVDGVVYSEELKMIISSNGEGTATIVKQVSADKYELIQTLETKPGQKTIVYSALNRCIYLSGADLEIETKKIKEGTFALYCYGIK